MFSNFSCAEFTLVVSGTSLSSTSATGDNSSSLCFKYFNKWSSVTEQHHPTPRISLGENTAFGSEFSRWKFSLDRRTFYRDLFAAEQEDLFDDLQVSLTIVTFTLNIVMAPLLMIITRAFHGLQQFEDWTTWSNELAVLRSSSAFQNYWVFNLIFIVTICIIMIVSSWSPSSL